MGLSSMRPLLPEVQQTRASISSVVQFSLAQLVLPVSAPTPSSESEGMTLLMPHSCFWLGIFFSLLEMSRRMEFGQTESQGTFVESTICIHGFSIWGFNQLWIKNLKTFRKARDVTGKLLLSYPTLGDTITSQPRSQGRESQYLKPSGRRQDVCVTQDINISPECHARERGAVAMAFCSWSNSILPLLPTMLPSTLQLPVGMGDR